MRARILAAAGRLFRTEGIDAVTIDRAMAAAGLTRGAFYAHFGSKTALAETVLRQESLLLILLRGRSSGAPDALGLGLRRILRAYLDPAHFRAVTTGCTLAALQADAARGPDTLRDAYADAMRATVTEMARGDPHEGAHPAYGAVLSLCLGALTTARTASSDGARAATLAAAADAADRLLNELAVPR